MRRPAAAERRENRISLRIELACGARIGPGKVALLEQIARTGSISAAGRAMRMSYRRAWDLIEELNRTLGGPVVATAAGGSGGGGAILTPLGAAVVGQFRAAEAAAAQAAREPIDALAEACGSRLREPG